MATIRERNGTYNAQVRRVGFPTQTATFDTYAEAEAWAVSVESRMFNNEFRPIDKARSTKVAELFEHYRDNVSPKKKGSRWEVVRINRLLRTAKFTQRTCADPLADALREWRDDRLNEVSPDSVRRELGLISGIFQHAIKERGIPMRVNPAHEVAYPPKGRARNKRYSQGDVDKLIAHFGFDEAVYPDTTWGKVPWIMLMAIETAMRLGEVCDVDIADVHLDECWLRIRDSKNGSERDVPLSPRAVQLLTVVVKGRSDGKLFDVNKDTVGVYYREGRDACGLHDLRFHDTRHEATTRLAKRFNMLELSKVTGHKDPRSLSVYYNPTAAELAKKMR